MAIFALLIIPLCAAVVATLIPRNHQYITEYCAVIAGVLEALLGLFIVRSVIEKGSLSFSTLFSVDALGALILLLTVVVGVAATAYSVGYLREEVRKGIIGFRRVREYFILFHLFFFAMFVAATTSSPLVMWTAIEATTLATALLISFYNK